jgi:hypothetical protein
MSGSLGNPLEVLRSELAKWWEDRWWLRDEYVRLYKERFSQERVNSAIGAVAMVFDEKWARSTDAHPACFNLLSQGSLPLQFLISLGQDLLAVRESLGFRKVLEDLREPRNFDSAKLELSIAALLSESGHEIEFHPKLTNGKESDVVARFNGEEVFFEVKIVRESEVTEALGEFTTWLGSTIDSLASSSGGRAAEMHYQIDLSSELADICRVGLKGNPRYFYDLAERTKTQIAEHMQRGSLDFCIPNMGSFTFRPKDVLPNSTIVHRPVSPSVEVCRILRPLFHGAIKQLPPDLPGLFVFRTAGFLEEELTRNEVEDFLREEAGEASHVSGIILLPVFYSLPSRWSPFKGFAVENPAACFPASSLHAFRTLVDACKLRHGSSR